jgi:hypothetical protein
MFWVRKFMRLNICELIRKVNMAGLACHLQVTDQLEQSAVALVPCENGAERIGTGKAGIAQVFRK